MAINSSGTRFMFGANAQSRVVVGRLVSIGEITADSEEIDVTTLDSVDGYREYVQGYLDAGVLAIEGYHAGDDAGQQALKDAYAAGSAGECHIVFPDGAQVNFKAYVKSYTMGAAKVNGAVGFSAKLRITGGIAYTGA